MGIVEYFCISCDDLVSMSEAANGYVWKIRVQTGENCEKLVFEDTMSPERGEEILKTTCCPSCFSGAIRAALDSRWFKATSPLDLDEEKLSWVVTERLRELFPDQVDDGALTIQSWVFDEAKKRAKTPPSTYLDTDQHSKIVNAQRIRELGSFAEVPIGLLLAASVIAESFAMKVAPSYEATRAKRIFDPDNMGWAPGIVMGRPEGYWEIVPIVADFLKDSWMS